ncbi:threonylcarbamoyladenosine tRNA methylthiotransferase [Wyeomyia smithii]|uniref:threonylcarbamoyladenosine tRNA methylthiotransferase n=1 Tax=Wyeomyia smithii TaxID=174621 RepID=UPI002467F39D|nr:threonylcarbamoyladenosine tRNA methylthiotransferase [Wyeomyia smithii]
MDSVDDIEDLINFEDLLSKKYAFRKCITVRSKRKTLPANDNETAIPNKNILENVVPETQKIFLKTWGCAHNNSDSEYMAGQLASYGYNITKNKDEADLWVLNSCTVKNPSEDTFRNEIQAAHLIGKHVVLAGCVPQAAPKTGYMQGLSVVGVHQIDRVTEVVEETLKGHTIRLLQAKKVDGKKVAGPSLAIPKIRKNPLIEIIPINTGCLNACTYCKTKFARANLVSYKVEEIVERAENVLKKEGVCEIWLTSEDTERLGLGVFGSVPS